MPEPGDLHYIPIDQLTYYPGNARRGDIDRIKRSLTRLGQYRTIVVRDTGSQLVILAGNNTTRGIQALIDDPPPADANCPPSFRQQLADRLVRCEISKYTDTEAAIVNQNDNRLNDLATYDDTDLDTQLEALRAAGDLEGLAWTLDELDDRLRDIGPGPGGDPDDVPKPPAEPITRPGDLWQLGPHRLLCGDATVVADVERLMGADRATLIYTDPPYGVGYEGGTVKRDMITGDNASYDTLRQLFGAAFVAAGLVGAERCGVIQWHADRAGMPLYDAVRAHGWTVRAQIIWNKNLAQFGALSAQYKQKHEPALYCVRPGKPPKWNGPTNEVTVWDCARAPVNEWHPTQKPVELGVRAISNHTDPGDVVLDLYGGSGSTLMAAHVSGRTARLMEIDPVYCDVICQRFRDHAGIEPELLAGVEPGRV